MKEDKSNEKINNETLETHTKSFDEHYCRWGWVKDVNEYIDKRGDNEILALCTQFCQKCSSG